LAPRDLKESASGAFQYKVSDVAVEKHVSANGTRAWLTGKFEFNEQWPNKKIRHWGPTDKSDPSKEPANPHGILRKGFRIEAGFAPRTRPLAKWEQYHRELTAEESRHIEEVIKNAIGQFYFDMELSNFPTQIWLSEEVFADLMERADRIKSLTFEISAATRDLVVSPSDDDVLYIKSLSFSAAIQSMHVEGLPAFA
jgi:hypothetical protein